MSFLEPNSVCHFSSVHPPTDNRILKECRSLIRDGYSVSFVVPTESEEDKKIVSDIGIDIISVTPPRNRLSRILLTTFCVFWKVLRTKSKIVHFHDVELLFVGLLLKLAGRKVIYDIHEYVTEDILTKNYLPKPLRALLSLTVSFFQRFTISSIDRAVCATPGIASSLGLPPTCVVANYPEPNEFYFRAGVPLSERGNTIIYLGMLSKRRGAVEMVQAMNLLNDQMPAKLLLAGKCSPAGLKDELIALDRHSCVEFLGFTQRLNLPSTISRCCAGLVLFHPGLNHDKSQPNKLFEYMSAGLPVLASNFPLWRELVLDGHCGLCVNPLSPKQIAEGMHALLTNKEESQRMGENGKRAVSTRFNWGVASQNLTNLYRTLRLPPHGAPIAQS